MVSSWKTFVLICENDGAVITTIVCNGSRGYCVAIHQAATTPQAIELCVGIMCSPHKYKLRGESTCTQDVGTVGTGSTDTTVLIVLRDCCAPASFRRSDFVAPGVNGSNTGLKFIRYRGPTSRPFKYVLTNVLCKFSVH